jgi:hypothetical protein
MLARIGNTLTPPEPEATPAEETEAPVQVEDPSIKDRNFATTEIVEERDTDPTEEAAEAVPEDAEDTTDEIEAEEYPSIDPPASWSGADKELFAQLPPEVQEIVAERESQRESYLTQKSQEASQTLRESQDSMSQIQAERQYLQQQLGPMLQQWAMNLVNDDARLESLSDPNSEHYDLEQYVLEKARLDKEKSEFTIAQQEQQRLQQANLQQDIAHHERLLIEAMPEWGKDPAKGRQELDEIRRYVISQGVDAELANAEYRAPFLTVARKAFLYDQMMAKKPEVKKKIAKAPKMMKPGAKREADPVKEEKTAARRQLRRARGQRQEADAFVRAMRGR